VFLHGQPRPARRHAQVLGRPVRTGPTGLRHRPAGRAPVRVRQLARHAEQGAAFRPYRLVPVGQQTGGWPVRAQLAQHPQRGDRLHQDSCTSDAKLGEIGSLMTRPLQQETLKPRAYQFRQLRRAREGPIGVGDIGVAQVGSQPEYRVVDRRAGFVWRRSWMRGRACSPRARALCLSSKTGKPPDFKGIHSARSASTRLSRTHAAPSSSH